LTPATKLDVPEVTVENVPVTAKVVPSKVKFASALIVELSTEVITLLSVEFVYESTATEPADAQSKFPDPSVFKY